MDIYIIFNDIRNLNVALNQNLNVIFVFIKLLKKVHYSRILEENTLFIIVILFQPQQVIIELMFHLPFKIILNRYLF